MSTDKEANFSRVDIKIPSKTPGWDLDVWKYLPKIEGTQQAQGLPIIVMAHGLSSNKLMGLAEYAEAFASLGYAVVVFDYRRWGASGGTPRHVVYVSEQLDDYRTVIKWVRQQPEFDPHRVVLWGTSFAGGHVVTLAGEPQLNLSAVVAQCPYLGNTPQPPLSWGFIQTLLRGVQDLIRQALGLSPQYIPGAARPGEVGLMTTHDSYTGLMGIVKAEGIYPNEVNASAIFEFPAYSPVSAASSISCPVLVVAPETDSLCPYAIAKQLKERSPVVELHPVPCGHFEVYPGAPFHEKSLELMKEFLLAHVQPGPASARAASV